jgi:hypothetical protein
LLLLLQDRSGGKDPGAGGTVLLLHVIGGHQRWCHGTHRGNADHRRRREGGRPLGFERSGSEKKLGSDYYIGERRVVEYWINLY